MAQDLVIKMLLKTGTFSNDLKSAKGQIQNFQKGCNTAGKALNEFGKGIGINIGTLTKFGGAIGAASLAGKALKGVIESNQVSGDAFHNTMSALKTTVGEFGVALARMDFTNFTNGLGDIIKRSKEAAEWIDQLGNTMLAYNLESAKARREMSRLRAIMSDANSTPQEKADAQKRMKEVIEDLKGKSEVAVDTIVDTILAELKAKGAVLSKEGGLALLDEILSIDTSPDRDAIKERLDNEYKAYQDAMDTLDKQAHPNRGYYTDGRGNTQYYNNTPEISEDEYLKGAEELARKYQKAIAYNATLKNMTDEEQKNLYAQRVQIETLGTELDDLNRKVNSLGKTNSETGGKTKTALEGSMNLLKEQASKIQKMRDDSITFSDQWVKYNNQLTGINAQIDAMEAKIKRLKNEEKMGESLPGLNLFDGVIGATTGSGTGLAMNTTAVGEAATKWEDLSSTMADVSTIATNLFGVFESGADDTAANILRMVATALPAIGTLIGSISALTAVEAAEAGIAATSTAVKSSKHWIEAIAAVAALTGVVFSAISASKNVGKFADGGIVGGSSYTGDRLTANVNSGEMILNKNQQGKLFSMINGGIAGGNNVVFHISGNDLIGVLNNTNRKNKIIR